MGEQKEEDLYRNFSRKDLQGLCKKYGLPANTSNSEMATALILYLEKKNINSRTLWNVTRSHPYPSGSSELHAWVRTNLAGGRKKDCRDMASHNGSGKNQFNCHRDARQNDVHNRKGLATSDKASEDTGTVTQLHRDNISRSGIPENTFSSVLSSTSEAPLPNFTFDVNCEDGIQLYVDLNSTPSEWVESMRAGVHICHDVYNLKAESSHQEVGDVCCSEQRNGSVQEDPHKETNSGKLEDNSCPTTVMTDVMPRADDRGGEEGSSLSAGPILSDTVHNRGHLGEEQAMLSSRYECHTEGQNCGSAGIRKETVKAADSDADRATQIKASKYPWNTSTSDANGSKLEHPSLNTIEEKYKEPLLQKTCGPSDPVQKCSRLSDAASAEISASPCSTAFNQEMSSTSSRVRAQVESADPPQNTRILNFGMLNTVQFQRDMHQMRAVQVVDHSQYALSSSPFISSLSELGQRVEPQCSEASILNKSSRQITSWHTKLNNSFKNTGFSNPPNRYQPLGVVNIADSIEREKGSIISLTEAGDEVVEIRKKDASLSPCSSSGRLDLAVPKQNGSDHCNSTNSSRLSKDECTQSMTNVGNLGSSIAREGRQSPECLNFGDPLGTPRRKPTDSESIGEFKKKRHLNSGEDQSQSLSPEAMILGTSKLFSGNPRASRRRSSRHVVK